MTIEAAPTPDELAELVRRIDAASKDAVRAIDVHERLAVTMEESGTPAAVVDAAFLYIEKGNRREKGKVGDFFGPIGQVGDIVNPPLIKDMPVWTKATWELCAERVAAPVARARLHDLCFVARLGNGREQARAAIEAYVELGDLYPMADGIEVNRLQVALGATHALARALDLARVTGQDDLALVVIGKLIAATRCSLDDPVAGAGVVLGFLDPLVHDRARLAEVDDLLARARGRYENDLWNTLSTIELELMRPGVTDEEREHLHRDEVLSLMKGADEAPPMNAIMHLQDAAQRAQNHNLADLFEQIAIRLQSFNGQDVGLVRHEVKIEIPPEAVESFITQFVGTPSWQEALVGLVSVNPASGHIVENQSEVAALPAISPLVSMLAVTSLDSNNLPKFTATSDAEKAEYHLAEAEVRRLQMYGPIHVEILRRVAERWAPIDENELAEFLRHYDHIPEPVARAMARAFGRFFAGDHEGAIFTVAPRIERVAREHLLHLGAPLYKPALGSTSAKYPGLGTYLGMLDDRGLDESWGRFLGTLLTRREGMGLRNNLLHGAVDDPSYVTAGLTLIAAIYLALWPNSPI
jgi:hypothetical protein